MLATHFLNAENIHRLNKIYLKDKISDGIFVLLLFFQNLSLRDTLNFTSFLLTRLELVVLNIIVCIIRKAIFFL